MKICNNCQLENVKRENRMVCAVCRTYICSDCFELDEANAPNCPLCPGCYIASRGEAVIILMALEREINLLKRACQLLKESMLEQEGASDR